ncbi:arginase family protein [Aquimarina sp. ERC-38]|uniref:arginase family protein n=1 Tax=Aquimarina sp. ERC-38 TaxID=2949996 RepID=UPI0022454935|nr:arginase family protein [Aquimarina sp. ERC-38]UZO82059.1 arginase family protein [Aquimarina sp. ERC-38]
MNPTATFAGISDKYAGYETSKTIIIPVPFEEDSNWIKGVARGPEALLTAAQHMELYDIETDSEVYKEGIHLTDPVTLSSNTEMVEEVYAKVKKYIKRTKFVTILGGEPSVSIGAVKAANECFDDLTVLHIGANANLQKEFEGSQYHRNCAMSEANRQMNLVQVGIRSMHKNETTLINADNVFFANEMATDDYWMDTIVDALTDDVYLCFDLNGMDPSLLPAVTRPEPGGLFWYETLEFLHKVFQEKNVVGFDMTGLSPLANDKSSDILAARIFYKMLSYKFEKKE